MNPAEVAPLHRLLERAPTTALLREFEALLPGCALAVIGADGRLVAGAGEWPRADLAARLARGETGWAADVRLFPLTFQSHVLGALAARGAGAEAGLQALRQTLTLLVAQAVEKREVAHETLDRYREINLLYRVAETIGACLDPDEIPHLELVEAGRAVESDASVVLLAEAGGALEAKAASGSADDVAALPDAAHSLIAQVRATGRPDILIAEGAPLPTLLCAPLRAGERVLGVILLGRRAARPVFTAGDEKLVMALASQAGIALEKAWLHRQEITRQRMEQELAVGRRIQLSLLPEACPVVPGWEFAATYEAANEVGGDFYDFFRLPESPQHVGFVIADVTGKGVPAALMMAFCRTVIRSEAARSFSPGQVLERANELILQDNRTQLLLSAFYGLLDTHTGRLAYANGGHDHPLWTRAATGECRTLESRGMVLGAFAFLPIDERAIIVEPGDRLVFYTDGVTEARAPDGGMFGEDRLQAVIATEAALNADETVRRVVASVKAFAQGTPPADDLTLLVIRRGPAA